MIQEAPETRVNQQDNKKGISLGIQQVFRYGIQIITDFGETGSREIELLDSALYNMNEAKILQIDIKNSGERWLRPFLYADLYDAEGQLIERMEGGRHRIFPGTSARYKIDLSAIKENQCTAMLLFDNKDTFVFGARMKLDFTQLQKK